jgi:hypothetical protein
MNRLSSFVGDYSSSATILDRRQFTAVGGELSFPLTYIDGGEEVYVNGDRLSKGPAFDYITKLGIIEFNRPLQEGDLIILIGRSISTNTIPFDPVEGVEIFNTVADMIAGTDTYTGQVIQTLGYANPADGRSGSYFYKELIDKSLADGIRYIDTGRTILEQGTGTGTGVWELQVGLIADVIDIILGDKYSEL